VYCIDTSALLDVRRLYPGDVFDIWDGLSGLVEEARLIAPAEVYEELKDGTPDDEVLGWARRHTELFAEVDGSTVKRILDRFPQAAAPSSDGPNADVHVVALALAGPLETRDTLMAPSLPLTVIQHESKKTGRADIPSMCDSFAVPRIDLVALYRRERWRFRRDR
jgi:hypothetical protein